MNVRSLTVGRHIQGILNNSALSKSMPSYPETSRPEGMHIDACAMVAYLIERRCKIERRTGWEVQWICSEVCLLKARLMSPRGEHGISFDNDLGGAFAVHCSREESSESLQ